MTCCRYFYYGGFTMENCIFCRIISGDIPSDKVYEDEWCYAFRDIHPQAPAHALIVPKTHVPNLASAAVLTDAELAGCLRAAASVAKLLGIDGSGYRVASNCGSDACQSVSHLHFHIMGGRQLSPDMG
jgi:histidine triad (HIT) family protein